MSKDCKLVEKIPYNFFALNETSVEFRADNYVSFYLDAKQFITAIMNLQALFASDKKIYI